MEVLHVISSFIKTILKALVQLVNIKLSKIGIVITTLLHGQAGQLHRLYSLSSVKVAQELTVGKT